MRPAETAAAVVVPATVKLMTVTVPSGAVYVSLFTSPVVIVPPGVNVSTSATGVAFVLRSAGSKVPLTQIGAVVTASCATRRWCCREEHLAVGVGQEVVHREADEVLRAVRRAGHERASRGPWRS
jgi:hypothetical protein